MKVNKRKATGLFGLGLALTVIACGPDGMEMMGDAMVDAGEMLMDAGGAVSDAGDAMTSDAAAQEPRTFTALCDQNDGGLYFAEVMTSLDPMTAEVAAFVCDPDPPTGIGLGCSSVGVTFDATRVRAACGSDPSFSNATARIVIR